MNDPETILLIAWLVISAVLLVVTARALKDSTEVMRLQQEHAISIQELARILEAPPHKVQELADATDCKVCHNTCCTAPDFVRRMACGCMESRLHSESCFYYVCKNCDTSCKCEPE